MMTRRIEPSLIVVFGATGDLMRRKLLPALYRLSTTGALPKGTTILGVARDTTLTEEAFRKSCADALAEARVKPVRSCTRRFSNAQLRCIAIAPGLGDRPKWMR